MSCRVAMLRMHRDGLIPLPAPRRRHSTAPFAPRGGTGVADHRPRRCAAGAAGTTARRSARSAVVARVRGPLPLPRLYAAAGSPAQMRYLVTKRRVLAVVGFGASAWKAAPRDRFIGWSVAQREARLQLVVNNARFLILPWVQVRNLASTVLARSSRRLPDDWQVATATDRCCWRPSCSPTASPVPATAPQTRRSDPRPRQTRRASYPRAAQERHLALPAQARFRRRLWSILTPTGRIFTFVSSKYSTGLKIRCFYRSRTDA